MDLTFLGANCLRLNTKSAKAIFDPTVPGIKVDTKRYDIIGLTHYQDVKAKEEQLLIDTPGEFEAKTISIRGIAAQAHMDEKGNKSATMFRIDANGIRVAVIGHIYPELSDDQQEALGTVDVLVIPVGGHGYTLDAEGAAKIVRSIEPKVVIPTHFADKAIKYEVPQDELKLFVDELGAPITEEEKYKIKAGTFPEQLTVVNIKRTS